MKQKFINVRCLSGMQQVGATIIGDMGVHPQLIEDGLSVLVYSVTHVPSGICFNAEFPSKANALSAAEDIQRLRDDWATFDPSAVSASFVEDLKAIYRRHGNCSLPRATDDRRAKLAKQEYSTDLNGYRRKQAEGEQG